MAGCTECDNDAACDAVLQYREGGETLGPVTQAPDMNDAGEVVVAPSGELLSINHEPVPEACYLKSTGFNLQSVVDSARHVVHGLGLRAHRVFLVWQRRDRRQEFHEFRRLELVPCKVSRIPAVDYEMRLRAEKTGLNPKGGVILSEISPNQVDESTLRGRINGQPLAEGEEFFYEVVRQPRFAGEKPERFRFAVHTRPIYNPTKFEFEIMVSVQDNERSPEGLDQTFEPAQGAVKPWDLLKR